MCQWLRIMYDFMQLLQIWEGSWVDKLSTAKAALNMASSQLWPTHQTPSSVEVGINMCCKFVFFEKLHGQVVAVSAFPFDCQHYVYLHNFAFQHGFGIPVLDHGQRYVVTPKGTQCRSCARSCF